MKAGMDLEVQEESLAWFRATDWIVGDPLLVKSGKEATVYRCEAHPQTGLKFVAAKFYRPRELRGFKNDAVYREGKMPGGRTGRAVQKKSKFGREVEFETWIGEEHATLGILHAAGADVPRPLTYSNRMILMEYVGDADGPAPPLWNVEFDSVTAREVWRRLHENIALMLEAHRIHGDLSPYNILFDGRKAIIIDFPQAVDPRNNRNAEELLHRDVDNVCRYFRPYGIVSDADQITSALWRRYKAARKYSYA